MSSLRRIDATCAFTVAGDLPSAAAISLFESPMRTCIVTARSAGVSIVSSGEVGSRLAVKSDQFTVEWIKAGKISGC